MTPQDIQVMHAIPGRVRFKHDSLKGAIGQAGDLRQKLSRIRGISHAETNPVTGSVLIVYDPAYLESLEFQLAVASALGFSLADLNAEQLAAFYGQHSNGANPGATTLGAGIQTVGGSLNSGVASLTGGVGDLRTLIPLGLFFLGFRSLFLADKVVFPAWYDYFWFALGSYFMLNREQPSKE